MHDETSTDPVSRPEALVAPLARLGGAAAALLILVALGLVCTSVFMRYALGTPPIWIDDVTGWVLVALIGLGAADALRRGAHISIDLMTGHLKGRARRLQAAWAELCVILFALVLAISTWEAIHFNIDFGAWTSGAVEIEAWIPLAPLMAGAVLLGLMAFARLLGRLTGGAR